MRTVIENHNLHTVENPRVILALNARLLHRSLSTFDSFLSKYSTSSILAWTGSGEPPILRSEVERIALHFTQQGMQHSIEFDCHCTDG